MPQNAMRARRQANNNQDLSSFYDEVPPENYGPAYNPNPVLNHPNYNFPPGYVPPAPPPPVYRPLGFNTLAPVGVAEGGWGGGVIKHETAAEQGAPLLTLPSSYTPSPMPPNWGPLLRSSGGQQQGGQPQSLWAPPAPGTSQRALNPAPRDGSSFGGYSTQAPRNPNDLWAPPAGQQSLRPVNAMNQYKGSVNWSKPNTMQEY